MVNEPSEFEPLKFYSHLFSLSVAFGQCRVNGFGRFDGIHAYRILLKMTPECLPCIRLFIYNFKEIKSAWGGRVV